MKEFFRCEWLESWPGIIGQVIGMFLFLWWLP